MRIWSCAACIAYILLQTANLAAESQLKEIRNGGSLLLQADFQDFEPFENSLEFIRKFQLQPGETFCLFRVKGSSKTQGPIASNLLIIPIYYSNDVVVSSASLDKKTVPQATLAQQSSSKLNSANSEIKHPVSSIFSSELLKVFSEEKRPIKLDFRSLLTIAQKMGLNTDMSARDLILAMMAAGLFTKEESQSLFAQLAASGLYLNEKASSLFEKAASLGLLVMVTLKNIYQVFYQYSISFDLVEQQLRQAISEMGLEVAQTASGVLTLSSAQKLEKNVKSQELEKNVRGQFLVTRLEDVNSTVAVTKKASVNKIYQGGRVTYSITISGKGIGELTDLILVDVLAPNLILNEKSLLKNDPPLEQAKDLSGHTVLVWKPHRDKIAHLDSAALSCEFEVQIAPEPGSLRAIP